MKRTIYILAIFLFGCCLHAQTAEEVLAKVNTKYSAAQCLSYNTTYNLYKKADATKVYQTYKGSFTKNSNADIYVKIGETEFYNTKFINVMVSHKEKIIISSKPQPLSQQEYNIKSLLSMFTEGTIKDKQSHWEIELLPKPFSSLPYFKLVLHIGKDYYLKKQVFYYSEGTDFSTDYRKPDINYPRLEIVIGKPSLQPVPQSKFSVSQYFTIVSKSIKPTAKYANYELIDQR